MDKTKAKIQELVPSTLEIDNPCLFDDCICWNEDEHRMRNTPECQPIQLADVLLAIGQSKEYYTGIDATGEFIQAGEFGGMNRTNIMWDLTKSYDDQSQETKDFIGSILGIK